MAPSLAKNIGLLLVVLASVGVSQPIFGVLFPWESAAIELRTRGYKSPILIGGSYEWEFKDAADSKTRTAVYLVNLPSIVKVTVVEVTRKGNIHIVQERQSGAWSYFVNWIVLFAALGWVLSNRRTMVGRVDASKT